MGPRRQEKATELATPKSRYTLPLAHTRLRPLPTCPSMEHPLAIAAATATALLVPLGLTERAAASKLQDPAPVRTIGEHESPLTHIAVGKKGDWLVTADEEGWLRSWSLDDAPELRWEARVSQQRLGDIAVGGDELVFNIGLAAVTPVDVESGELKEGAGSPDVTARCTAVVGDPKDRWAWVATSKGPVVRLTPGNVNGWSRRKMENGGSTSLARDEAGGLLVVGGADGTLRFVNAKSASVDEKKVFELESGPVTAVLFAGKKLIAAGSEDGPIRLAKLPKGSIQGVLEGHAATIVRLASDTKGTRLASGDAEGSVRLWDIKQASEVMAFEPPGEGPIAGLAFLGKKGTELLVARGDQVSVWDLTTP